MKKKVEQLMAELTKKYAYINNKTQRGTLIMSEIESIDK